MQSPSKTDPLPGVTLLMDNAIKTYTVGEACLASTQAENVHL